MGKLLKFRIPGVQRYIFQTPNLKEIRGASAIMEDLCDEKMKTKIKAAGGEPYLLAAGFGVIYVPQTADVARVKALLREAIFNHTQMLRPQFGVLDFDPDSDKLGAVLEKFDREMTALPPTLDPALGLHTLFKSCQSCRRYPMTQDLDGGENLVCEACYRKRRRLKRSQQHTLPYWKNLHTFLENTEHRHKSDPGWVRLIQALASEQASSNDAAGEDPDLFSDILAQELEHIALQSQRDGYVCLVYADANSLGQALKGMHQKINAPQMPHGERVETMQTFSSELERAMRDATYQAILETWSELPTPKNDPDDESRLPFDILYLGGDDLLFVCTTDQGPAFVSHLCKQFAAQVQGVQDLKDLTLGVGLAFAKYHTPMSELVDFAKQLLTSAKRRAFRAAREAKKSSIDMAGYAVDYAALTDTTVNALNRLRSQNKDVDLTVLPCDLTGFNKLLKWSKKLNDKGIRAPRIMPVLEACRQSQWRGTLAAQALIGRMENKHSDALLGVLKAAQDQFGAGLGADPKRTDDVPWLVVKGESRPKTILGDLVELAPFLKFTQEEDS